MWSTVSLLPQLSPSLNVSSAAELSEQRYCTNSSRGQAIFLSNFIVSTFGIFLSLTLSVLPSFFSREIIVDVYRFNVTFCSTLMLLRDSLKQSKLMISGPLLLW